MTNPTIESIVEEFREKFVKRTESVTIGSSHTTLNREYEILNARKPYLIIDFIKEKLTQVREEADRQGQRTAKGDCIKKCDEKLKEILSTPTKLRLDADVYIAALKEKLEMQTRIA